MLSSYISTLARLKFIHFYTYADTFFPPLNGCEVIFKRSPPCQFKLPNALLCHCVLTAIRKLIIIIIIII